MTGPVTPPRPLCCVDCDAPIPPAHVRCDPCWDKHWAVVDGGDTNPTPQGRAQTRTSTSLESAISFARRGIVGLRSDKTVARYVDGGAP